MGRIAFVLLRTCAVLGATALLAACGSEPDAVESRAEPVTTDPPFEDDHDDDWYQAVNRESYPVSLEPALAVLDSVDNDLGTGWTVVDEWYHEPVGLAPTGCDELDTILALEEWGVITKFWLRDGTELYQHMLDIGDQDVGEELQRSFALLPESCPMVTANGSETQFAFAAGDDQIAMQVTGGTATWLYEPGRTSHSVVLGERNLLSIVQIVDSTIGEAQERELAEVAGLVADRMREVAQAEYEAYEADLEQ